MAVVLPAILAGQEGPVAHGGRYLFPDRIGLVSSRVPQECPDIASLSSDRLLELEPEAALEARSFGRDSIGPWSRLGCVRAMLWSRGVVGRTSPPYMRSGEGWFMGLRPILELILNREPTDMNALRLYAMLMNELGRPLAMAREEHGVLRSLHGWETREAAVRMVRAAGAGVTDPLVLRSCTSLLLGLGMWQEARGCALRSLVAGQDSTWHLLRLSLAGYKMKREPVGWLYLEEAIRSAVTPEDRAELVWLFARDRSDYDEVNRVGALSHDGLIEWIGNRIRDGAAEESIEPRLFISRRMVRTMHSAGTLRDCGWVATRTPRLMLDCTDNNLIPLYRRIPELEVDVIRIWKNADDQDEIGMLVPYWWRVDEADAPVKLEFVQGGVGTGFGAVTDSLLTDSRRLSLTGKRGIGGLLLFDTYPGTLSFFGALQQGERRSTFGADLTLPLNTAPVAISDLLIGPDGSPWSWRVGDTAYPAWPEAPIDRDRVIQFSWQIRSTEVIPDAELSIEVHELKEYAKGGPPALSMRMAVALDRGLHWCQQEMGMERLGRGIYVVGVRYHLPGGQPTVVRMGRVELR